MTSEELRPFWSVLAQPNETTPVNFPDTCILSITNACLPELPADDSVTPIRLFAHVKKLVSEEEITESDVLLASLIPKSVEQVQLNYVFSPLNAVELKVSGSVPVQLCGCLEPIIGDDEEEEEEEANEDANNEGAKEDEQ